MRAQWRLSVLRKLENREMWASLNKQATIAGWGNVIEDDGTVVSIKFPKGNLDAAYNRQPRSYSKDFAAGHRFFLTLKALREFRKAELTRDSQGATNHDAGKNKTSPDSGEKPGRKPGKVKLSSFEKQAIERYCEGAKPSVIDEEFSRRTAYRGVGKAKKEWREGDANLVIRAAKNRRYIQKTEGRWEIVTK